jgi:hypothetical protein
MTRNPERIRFVFNKFRGDSPSAKTWDEIDPVQQTSMLEGVGLGPCEVPVVAMVHRRNPIVITTERIVWQTSEGPRTLNLDEVSSVKAPEFFESDKHDVHQLALTTRNGQKYLLETEPGKVLFVLWNLLIRIIDLPKVETH